MSRTESVDNALTSVISLLEEDQNLRKTLKEAVEPLEEISRTAAAELMRLHSTNASQHKDISEKTLKILEGCEAGWKNVASHLPSSEFYRYQYLVSPTLKNLVSSVVMARFILHDELTPAFAVSSIIGVAKGVNEPLQLTAEDYLHGIIGMVNDLPRLSINAVTAQNFELPPKIAAFVNDIFASYSMLNLRNDALRRRFDTLKYDVKRCEDVVYDLTLRGLTPAPKVVEEGMAVEA
ncbi:GPI ethanolamine phosphate transferase 2/3 subunit F, partial [Tremellales sp. Uapishka_1]